MASHLFGGHELYDHEFFEFILQFIKDQKWLNFLLACISFTIEDEDHHIVLEKTKKVIKLLVDKGADVNAANCTINKTKDDKIDYFKPTTPLDRAISFGINKNKTILKKAGAKTWEQLVKEYNIDTSLERPEQIKMYEERRKIKK